MEWWGFGLAALFGISCLVAAVVSRLQRPNQERAFRVILCVPLAGVLAAFLDGLLLGSDLDRGFRLGWDAAGLSLLLWTPIAFFIVWIGLSVLSARSRRRLQPCEHKKQAGTVQT
jgi:hypothetical protein